MRKLFHEKRADFFDDEYGGNLQFFENDITVMPIDVFLQNPFSLTIVDCCFDKYAEGKVRGAATTPPAKAAGPITAKIGNMKASCAASSAV
jgi:hypothetical protein